MSYIYGLWDSRTYELRYIGKADNPQSRLQAHINEAKRGGRRHKDNWIRNLLKDGLIPEIEILEECTKDNWEEIEREWIREAREKGARLVNVTIGGEGVSGYSFTEEHKAKLSDSHKGKKVWNKGIPCTEEHKEKIRQANTGHKHTEESKKKMSERIKEAKKNSVWSENQKAVWQKMISTPASKETKEKLRIASLGNQHGLGYKHTDEAKKRISEGLKKAWAKKRQGNNE